MAKWADYLISEVSYGTNNLITKIKQHHDNGKTISQGEIIDRDTLTKNLGQGVKYMTVYSTLSRFKIGKNVNLRNSIISSNSSIKENSIKNEQVFLLGEGTKVLF